MPERSRFPRRAAWITRGALPAAMACLLAAFSCEDPMSPEEEYEYAQLRAAQWAEFHPDEWRLDLASQQLTRPEWSKPCAANTGAPFVALRYALYDSEIDLFFRCPIDGSATPAELEAAFEFVVLGDLPHGIGSPGWRFRVVTPSSQVSVAEGASLWVPRAERLLLEVDTPLFAILGESLRPACQPPIDGPALDGCHLTHPLDVPLRMTLPARFSASALD